MSIRPAQLVGRGQHAARDTLFCCQRLHLKGNYFRGSAEIERRSNSTPFSCRLWRDIIIYLKFYVYLFIIHFVYRTSSCPHAGEICPKLSGPHTMLSGTALNKVLGLQFERYEVTHRGGQFLVTVKHFIFLHFYFNLFFLSLSFNSLTFVPNNRSCSLGSASNVSNTCLFYVVVYLSYYFIWLNMTSKTDQCTLNNSLYWSSNLKNKL